MFYFFMDTRFRTLFGVKKPVIGMIHLAGEGLEEKISRALNELQIYQEEEVNGAIIEDYHATGPELIAALEKISQKKWDIKIGINYLKVSDLVFDLANDYNASFVQLDSVQGVCNRYVGQKKRFPNLVVLGGVRFKYQPQTGRTLEEDIEEGKPRCDAIVTTGEGTGIETPLEKLKQFKGLLKDFPLIVGAGVQWFNVHEQLQIVDGAIIGSYFKSHGHTQLPVDRLRVKKLMNIVKQVRKNYVENN